MRVSFKDGTLDHVHKEGLFKKVHTTYYTVTTEVIYSEEEKAIISQYGLEGKAILEHSRDANFVAEVLRLVQKKPGAVNTLLREQEANTPVEVTLGSFLNGGHTYIAVSPRSAVEHKQAMTQALQGAKQYLESMIEQSEQPDTFEL